MELAYVCRPTQHRVLCGGSAFSSHLKSRSRNCPKSLNSHRTEAQQGGKTERKEPFSPLQEIECAAETSHQILFGQFL